MMDYQLFKRVIAERIADSLPPAYADYKPKFTTIRKVNEEKDVLNLIPPKCERVTAIPNIYMDDMYQIFTECEDLDAILEYIVRIVTQFTGSPLPVADDFDFSNKLDCLIMNLINTEMNKEYLKNVPHKPFLDLSIVYRFIMQEEGDGFGTVVLTNELMEALDITLEEAHLHAHENTLRLLPAKITEPIEGFYLMSNKRSIGGASTMLFDECTNMLAEKIKADFFIIPGSIHEIYAVPADGQDIKNLICMLEEANRLYISPKDILSQSIYFYDYETKEIQIAGSYIKA